MHTTRAIPFLLMIGAACALACDDLTGVLDGPVVRLELESDTAYVDAIGDTVDVGVTAYDSAGNSVPLEDIDTAGVSWSSSDSAVVEPVGIYLVSRGTGTATVTAYYDTLSASGTVISKQIPARVEILEPDPLNSYWVADTIRLQADAWDARDVPIADPELRWAVSGSMEARVQGDSVLMVSREGSGTITASNASGSAADTVVIHVPVDWASLDVGWSMACALSTGGVAYCWGNNQNHQLADLDDDFSSTPVAIPVPERLVDVRAGSGGCGIDVQGALWCWGQNAGDGERVHGISSDGAPVPVKPDLPGPVRSVDRRSGMTCAALENGTLYCWGRNDRGGLGIGTNEGPDTCEHDQHCALSPVKVNDIPSVTHISTGIFGNCAIAGGAGYCWGEGDSGQIGDGATEDRFTPTPILVEEPIAQLEAGDASCAVVDSGEVVCWGANWGGMLGRGDDDIRYDSMPGLVAGSARFSRISIGANAVCGITLDNEQVQCWGENAYGQLGDGTQISRSVPGPIVRLGRHKIVSVGLRWACALAESREIFCWGKVPVRPGTATGDDLVLSPKRVPKPTL